MAGKKISYRDCPIAIVGMGAIFPGALDPRGLWDAVLAGKWLGVEPPAGRWALPAGAIRQGEGIHPDKVRSTTVCAIDPLPPFASSRPGQPVSQWSDPPVRLALHAGAAAWNSAKLDQVDPARIGVLLGNIVLPTAAAAARAEAVFGNRGANETAQATAWDDLTVAMPSAALAAHLGLGGAHQTLDAACASSLYSLHLASLELMLGRLDAVFAGGVSSPDSLYTQMGFSQLRALSPTGRCRPFDRAADGLIVGEGAGIFVLKRLADARSAGDEILAVIAGMGLSNDIEGGLLAPSTEGQLRAMRQAYRASGLGEGDVDYFECHATGAPVGDRVELKTLGQLLGPRDPRAKIPIGSVKGNIGHLLTAAGAAALAKVILALTARRIPAMPGTAGLEEDFGDPGCPVFLPEKDAPWIARGNRPRRAGVSAFGFGGINAHLVIEEPPARAVSVALPAGSAVPILTASVEPLVQVTALARAGCLGQESAHHNAQNNAQNNAHQIGRIRIAPNRFRIPPVEVQSMLPQQIWALEAACDLALQKEWETEQPGTAVVLQVALDVATTNHHLRWKALAEGVTEGALPAALDANKVMGSLASIAASRIARQLKLGGPCFTVSSGTGGMGQALRIAQALLSGGGVDRVIVGAATSPDDARASAAADGSLASSGGAVLLVLERDVDAEGRAKAGLARIFGTGVASFSAFEPLKSKGAKAIEAALETGFAAAGSHPDAVTWIGTSASNSEFSDLLHRELGDFFGPRIKPRLRFLDDGAGETGMVAGVRSPIGFLAPWQRLAQAIEAIEAGRYPGSPAVQSVQGRPDLAGLIQTVEPTPWLVDRENRPRTSLVASAGAEGNASILLAQEIAKPTAIEPAAAELWPEAIFLLEEDHREALEKALTRLETLAKSQVWPSLRHLADAWARATAPRPQAKLGLALVLRASGASDGIAEILAAARQRIAGAKPIPTRSGDVFFHSEPLGPRAGVCLVYPGSGQAAFDMGRRLALTFPDVLEAQAALSASAQASFVPLKFWSGRPADAATADPREQIMAQISHGCLATAILGTLGVEPAFALGQSLGESTMMFALGAWPQRDRMLGELMASTLFVRDVVRPWDAVRKSWNLPAGSTVDWAQALFSLNLGAIRSAIQPGQRAYPLIELAPRLNLVGGEKSSLAALAQKLGVEPIWLPGGTSVHGPMAAPIAKAWRALHHGPVILVPGMRMFLAGCPAAMPPVADIVAEAFVEAATMPISFVELVRRAYGAGARFFLEVGPGASCAGLIPSILGETRHAVCALAATPEEERFGLLGMVGALIAERIPLDREALGRFLYLPTEGVARSTAQTTVAGLVEVIYGPPPVPWKLTQGETPQISATAPSVLAEPISMGPALPPVLAPQPFELSRLNTVKGPPLPFSPLPSSMDEASEPFHRAVSIGLLEHETQEVFLRFARAGEALVGQIHQLGLPQLQPTEPGIAQEESVIALEEIPVVRRSLDRSQCLDFAIGSVARALGNAYAMADTYPTRVRLPDEPLMLVDRVLSIEGDPQSMKSGRVVTEHDVLVNGWYLDQGRMPISLTVESGQADMLLAGWLGIDLHTKGEAVYRLLDATIAFEGPLPKPGETIRYDIRVLRFFQHGETWLFRFEYDGSVGGRPLLRMREGCAGFFTNEALAAGKGLLERDFPPMNAARKGTPVPPLGPAELARLRQGDLAGAFGQQFTGHPVREPATIPAGKMALFDRVVELDPQGGAAGLGRVVTEDDIDPDDWFLTCHFIDDQVMPGTLMYEACLLSLRVLLLRKGWVAPAGSVTFEGVPGVESALKCRGQVIRSTRVARYEIEIAEIRAGANPSVIAHAVMFADGRPIVSVRAMSLQLQGADSRDFAPLGGNLQGTSPETPANRAQFPASPRTEDPSLPMDHPRLLEFCTGLPSRAFGERFLPFDQGRVMARLPRPPYLFMDDVVEFRGEPLTQTAPKECIARFRLSRGDWWDKAARHGRIPFAVLLEIALQPCGWISAYSGAALTSGEDLSYRNLGGTGNLRADPVVRNGLIEVHAKLERVSRSGGMILHFFSFDVRLDGEPLYDGTTYFGFFTKGALATQVGITDTKPWHSQRPGISQPGHSFRALPSAPLLMLDRVEQFEFDGGPKGLGFAKGIKKVNPAEWFFDAHFYQDPVMPGSLGLEAFLQLAGLLADPHRSPDRPALLQPGAPAHTWVYRGQVIPAHDTIVTRVEVVERHPGRIVANGFVEIDGRIIYSMERFTIAVV